MNKDQQPPQNPSMATTTTNATAASNSSNSNSNSNQFLLMDELMIMYAMCAFPDYPSTPANTLPSPSPSSPSLLPDATALRANAKDHCSPLGYYGGEPTVHGLSPIVSSMQANPHPQLHPLSQPLSLPQPEPSPQPLPLPSNAVYPPHIYRCSWADCRLEFTDPKPLLAHLGEDHVGRRQRGNLNLSCQWTGCSRVARKRDHMISHLKSHVPFWPHLCTVCGNRFKHTTGLNRHMNRHSERGEINMNTMGEKNTLKARGGAGTGVGSGWWQRGWRSVYNPYNTIERE